MVADPATRVQAETYLDSGDPRLLMRFDGYVHNAGAGALEISGSDGLNGMMGRAWQHVYGPDGGDFPGPQLLYETNDSHNHWHLMRAARYSLWNSALTAEVAPAMKVGFCLIDSERREAPAGSTAFYTEAGLCGRNNPNAASLTMGISAGWRDYYGRSLAFQWVDVSDVPPGSYRLRSEVDPEGVIRESTELNLPAYAAEDAVVPGHLARDVSQAAAPGSVQVPLAATTFGAPGSGPEFKIVEAPRHGQLDQPVGQWFSADRVQYTPSPGSTGDDSFRFVARDPSSAFPLSPPAAVALLGDGGRDRITISGAPEQLRTGASAQLSAVGESAVTWSVDGTPGGNAGAGTISATGLYRAPANVPPGGQVRVSAQSATGASGDVAIRIVEAPKPRPASSVPGVIPRSRGSNPLSRLRIARHGRKLLVGLRSRRAGRVIVRARRSGLLIGRCSGRIARDKRMTCAIRLPRSIARAALFCRIARTARLALPGLSVSATLYVKGRKRAVRTARLRQ